MRHSVTLSLLSFGLLLGSAHAYASIEDALANICTIVKADDKSELRKKMTTVQTDYRLKLPDYYTGISCDGNSLIRTAVLSNAYESGTLLVKKMPKNELEAPEADGKTLSAWLKDNGLESTPVAIALADRI